MERQLNYLIREQLYNINRSYPAKILSEKLADLIAKYLVCHARDRQILHGITQAQIAYNYICYVCFHNQSTTKIVFYSKHHKNFQSPTQIIISTKEERKRC